jgi:hypothetical protein
MPASQDKKWEITEKSSMLKPTQPAPLCLCAEKWRLSFGGLWVFGGKMGDII